MSLKELLKEIKREEEILKLQDMYMTEERIRIAFEGDKE